MHSAGFRNRPTERRNAFDRLQWEIREAKRIKREEGCTWTEALRLAVLQTPPRP